MPDTLRLAMAGETDIVFHRTFAATPALVWRALTETALIAAWLWARQAPMTVCEVDFRVGGRFRWVWERSEGGARDAVAASGMAEGMAGTCDTLETILAGDPA